MINSLGKREKQTFIHKKLVIIDYFILIWALG
jgi:hypothetical protein